MNDTEKLMVSRLIMAIDDCLRSQSFRIGLPPKFGELDRQLDAMATIRQERRDELSNAINAAKAAIAT